MKYVAYYRVSTQKQGVSGLGLESQKQIVSGYIKGEIFKEFTEIESGKKSDKHRPQLREAINLCKLEGATLVIAKLDRLARNVAFTSRLLESGVKFVACDNPNASNLTIHILSAIAEDEAKRISQRTKDALNVLKSKGVKLGSPSNTLTDEHRKKAYERNRTKAKENENNKRARAYLKLLVAGSLRYFASELNRNGFRTSRGGEFTAMQVKRLLE